MTTPFQVGSFLEVSGRGSTGAKNLRDWVWGKGIRCGTLNLAISTRLGDYLARWMTPGHCDRRKCSCRLSVVLACCSAGLSPVFVNRLMNKYRQYERVFNQFDENGDGKISPCELQKCVGLIGGVMSLEEAEAAIVSMDSDEDGLLCLEDFVKLVEEAGEEEKVNDLKEAFRMYEMDGSGCITPKSLKRMLSRLGESKTIEECKLMIDHFDINGDGQLSFDEFMVMMSC
ncbi:EF-hand domain-containing protein [Forsythia ovata]|uniref:EF-hand domain-containing protein n=2 Tax=Forsythia ovata TaxID=205694 RepID=A0ABD1VN10_9LAMI